MDPKYLYQKALVDRNVAGMSNLTISEDSLESSIPAFVQDAYRFIDIVYAVRNGSFNIPRCVSYSRFRYMIAAGRTASCSRDPESGS